MPTFSEMPALARPVKFSQSLRSTLSIPRGGERLPEVGDPILEADTKVQSQVGFGVITVSAAGYPGYNSVWPKSAASIAEVLKLSGYSAAAFGKGHNTRVWEVNRPGRSTAGPPDWASNTSTVFWAPQSASGSQSCIATPHRSNRPPDTMESTT